MTTLTLRVSRALGRRLHPGDAVVVTELDHHANVDPWKALAAEHGVVIRVARFDPDSGTLDTDDLAAKLDGARILAIGAASNAIGTITDIAPIAARARDAGATVFVDAVHFAPHRALDVRAMGADFVVVSPYKFYGPHLGVLWGRRDAIEELDLPRVESAPDNAPDRIETGTLPFENIAGAAAALDFIDGVGLDAIHAHAHPLLLRLRDALDAIPGVRTFGPPDGHPRTPTLAFTIDGVDPAHAAGRLARQGLFLSHGDFYATTVVRRIAGGRGLLRAGIMAYTTAAEVDRLAAGAEGLL